MKKLFTFLLTATLGLALSACGGGGGGGSSSSAPPTTAQGSALPSQTAANQVQADSACDPAPATPRPIDTWLSGVRPSGAAVANERGVVCVREVLNTAATQLLGYGSTASKSLAATLASSAGYTGTVLSAVYAQAAPTEQGCFDRLDAQAGGLMRFGQLQDLGVASQVSAGPTYQCVMIAAAKQGAGSAGQVPVVGAQSRYHVYPAGLTPDAPGPQVVLSLLTRTSADSCAAGNSCYPAVHRIAATSDMLGAVLNYRVGTSSPVSVAALTGVQVPSPQEPLSTTGGLLRVASDSSSHCASACTLVVDTENEQGQAVTLTVHFNNAGEVIGAP